MPTSDNLHTQSKHQEALDSASKFTEGIPKLCQSLQYYWAASKGLGKQRKRTKL